MTENIVYRLNALNKSIDDARLITKILTTLPNQFKYFVYAWESTPIQEKTLTNLIPKLQVEEQRLNKHENQEELVAFKSTIKKYFKCNGTNHIVRF